MERVTGIGGIFFKAKDPIKLKEWYAQNLGIPMDEGGNVIFLEGGKDASGAERKEGMTIWSPFAADTKYFRPSEAPFMVNYRVSNLEAMLRQLSEAGIALVGEPESSEYGRFAWLMDPEGNKVELWEPPAVPPG